MSLKYDKFHMKYGWLGRQASINVGSTVSFRSYEAFRKYYRGIMDKDLPRYSLTYRDILLPIMATWSTPIVIGLNYRKHIQKIREELYFCLTYVFFRDGLSEFLGD